MRSPILSRVFPVALAAIVLFSFDAAAHMSPAALPAGVYTLDPEHTSIVFKINHLGFSTFVGRFDHAEGEYTYNPGAPEKSALDVVIRVDSIDTNVAELDEALRAQTWFDTLKFPRATFRATHIELTGATTAEITGDFTLHGVTHSLTLAAALTGAGKMPFARMHVMGFHAVGHIRRADYGVSNLEPMVGDDVTLEIDTEFDKEK